MHPGWREPPPRVRSSRPGTDHAPLEPVHVRRREPKPASGEALRLGLPGFAFEDLYRPEKLALLHQRFLEALGDDDAALRHSWDAYRQGGRGSLPAKEESALLVQVAPHVARFVTRLFGVEDAAAGAGRAIADEKAVFAFKREFIQRRVLKKGAPDRPSAADFPALDAQARLLLARAFPDLQADADAERALARAVNALLELDRAFAAGPVTPESAPGRRWAELVDRLRREPALAPLLAAEDDGTRVAAILSLLDRWTSARLLHPDGRAQVAGWVSHQQPRALEPARLVEMQNPEPELPELHEGLPEHLRRRDGFDLTDRRTRAAEAARGGLLPLLPRARQGLLPQGPARQGRRGAAQPAGHRARRLPAGREDLRDAALSRQGIRSARWPWS